MHFIAGGRKYTIKFKIETTKRSRKTVEFDLNIASDLYCELACDSCSNNMPFPRICPISIVVFVATAIAVTRQKRNQSKLDSKKVKNDLLFHIVFVLGAPGVGK